MTVRRILGGATVLFISTCALPPQTSRAAGTESAESPDISALFDPPSVEPDVPVLSSGTGSSSSSAPSAVSSATPSLTGNNSGNNGGNNGCGSASPATTTINPSSGTFAFVY